MTQRWPALAFRDVRRILAVRFLMIATVNIQAVAVGWQVYDLTREPIYLGLIGLAQFLPSVLLVLVTGAAADRFERRFVAAGCLLVLAFAAVALLVVTMLGTPAAWPILMVMTVVGTARAFLYPAVQALIPTLVPVQHMGNAVALNTIAARAGASLGPLVGGVLYGVSGELAYAVIVLAFLTAGIVTISIGQTAQDRIAAGVSLRTLTAGLHYIWQTKPILGAISLDIYAVLMGGVTALLPVFARDIFDAGPTALGLLRAAPAVGGLSTALYLSLRPIRRRAGMLLFLTMGLFGLSTIAFGLSEILWVSVLALFVMGASDVANVYFRWTLVQVWTPDVVRGRVAAVTSVSATGSNELGDFRAGLSAALIGASPAVILGGFFVVVGVIAWMRFFPELGRVANFDPPAWAKDTTPP